jgi:hypothetical protein
VTDSTTAHWRATTRACRLSTIRPTRPKIDRWLRKQPPRVELALRYSIRGRFRNLGDHRAFNARIDELFATLKPGEDELAAIVRHAREIGQAIEGQLGAPSRRSR